jgi:hypothetical protein
MSALRRWTARVASTLLLTTACSVGGWSRGDLSAAKGGSVRVEAGEARLIGELLLADQEGLLLLADGRIRRVPWTAVLGLDFRNRPVEVEAGLALGAPPLPGILRAIQLASRYPYGLTPEQLGRVLADLGQDGIDVIR